MAINFPNDPATNPGDGGQWIDPDGNTWTVEIVSGEAIWTMTGATDTGGGGGGGAVDSVNSQTGVVSLGIQDMNDYELNPASSFTWAVEDSSDYVGGMTNGGAYVSTQIIAISPVTEQGNKEAELLAWSQSLSYPTSLTFILDGVSIVKNITTINDDSAQTGNYFPRFSILTDDPFGTHPYVGQTLEIQEFTAYASQYILLAEGDILQWNNADQKFKPAQLAAGTALDGLLSVDGDAVKYGTAPTLGVDGTDLVIPTMGQVRGAIASNGGTSVSLNDLSDCSYTGGSLEPTALDQVVFSSADVPANATWKFYVNADYGLNFGTYLNSSADGAFIKAHHQKGIVLQADNGLPVLLTGNSQGTTNNRPELRFCNGNPWYNTAPGNYIGFKMPAGVSSNVTWTLPAVDGAASSVLTSNGAGQLTFEALPAAEAPITTYEIGYESTTSYKFTGPGLDGTELNPTLYFVRGQKYKFNNVLGAHPFQLQTVAGTGEAPYTDGVTGSQPIDLGDFEWEVPMDAPSQIFYQCTAHTAMAGTIKVLDSSGGGGGGGAVDSVNSQTGVVSLGIQDMNDFLLYIDPPVFYEFDKFADGTNRIPNQDFEWGQFSGEIKLWNRAVGGVDMTSIFAALPTSGPYWISWTDSQPGSFVEGTYTNKNIQDEGASSEYLRLDGLSTFAQDITGSLFITFTKPGEPIYEPLDEGDHLEWDATYQAFRPTALVDNDTKRIQDQSDFKLNQTDPGLSPVRTGTWDSKQVSPNWPDTEGEWMILSGSGNVGNGTEPVSLLMLDDLDKDGNSFATLWAEIDATPADTSLRYTDTNGTKGPFQILGLGQQGDGRAAIYWDVNDYPGDSPAGDLFVEFLQLSSEPIDIPLAEGDVLQWDDSIQKFTPGALVDNDTKRIQDMDDYGLKTVEGSFILSTRVSISNDVNGSSKWNCYSPSGQFIYYWKDESVLVDNLSIGDEVSLQVPGMTAPHVATIESLNTNGNAIAMRLSVFAPSEIINAANGTPLTITCASLPGSAVSLAEGDILQWNDTVSKFQPTPLDYSQINNTPAANTRILKGVTTAALAVGATESGEITGTGATGFLLTAQTDRAVWIRLYCDAVSSAADASRTKDEDPLPGSGVLFEALYSSVNERPITPGTTYFNLEGEDKLYYRITNESAVENAVVTVNFKLLPME